jgi:hypothetical protein
MAKDILKEAIADAKAVREVALANAKAALEEAFTPKLQSMLSAKLSEELEEEYDEDETSEGMYYDEDEDMDEVTGMEMDEDDMDEAVEETTEESVEEEVEDLDEEIDLEEILNELELEESEEVSEETVAEGDEDITEGDEEITEGDEDITEGDEEEVEEGYQSKPNATADDVQNVTYKVDNIYEGEDFDLDALLEEINNLDENNEEMNEVEEVEEGLMDTLKKAGSEAYKNLFPDEFYDSEGKIMWSKVAQATGGAAAAAKMEGVEEELEETKAALETVRTELNEVNLLNSKLLYVNRIFKANTLDEAQKLRVVETLDKAETAKEAKLIYETIKDTFNVAKSKKESFKNKTKSLQEGLGMASKAAGTSTAPKKEVIAESSNMVSRFQKLANITINE